MYRNIFKFVLKKDGVVIQEYHAREWAVRISPSRKFIAVRVVLPNDRVNRVSNYHISQADLFEVTADTEEGPFTFKFSEVTPGLLANHETPFLQFIPI